MARRRWCEYKVGCLKFRRSQQSKRRKGVAYEEKEMAERIFGTLKELGIEPS